MTRRTNVTFDPKQTIEILKLGPPDSELNDEQKLDLVKKYMDVSIISNNFKKKNRETVSRHYHLTTISRDFWYTFNISSIGNMNIILSHPPLIVDVKPILTQISTFFCQNWHISQFYVNQLFNAHPTMCKKYNYVHFYTMKTWKNYPLAKLQ